MTATTTLDLNDDSTCVSQACDSTDLQPISLAGLSDVQEPTCVSPTFRLAVWMVDT
jgi:hypothetical protein